MLINLETVITWSIIIIPIVVAYFCVKLINTKTKASARDDFHRFTSGITMNRIEKEWIYAGTFNRNGREIICRHCVINNAFGDSQFTPIFRGVMIHIPTSEPPHKMGIEILSNNHKRMKTRGYELLIRQGWKQKKSMSKDISVFGYDNEAENIEKLYHTYTNGLNHTMQQLADETGFFAWNTIHTDKEVKKLFPHMTSTWAVTTIIPYESQKGELESIIQQLIYIAERIDRNLK